MNHAKDGKSVEITRVTADGFGLLLPEGVDSIHHPERYPVIMQPGRKAPDAPGGGKR